MLLIGWRERERNLVCKKDWALLHWWWLSNWL